MAHPHANESSLERRLRREREARREAERLLDQKSRALYDALRHATEIRQRLQLALWASGETIWEWRLRGDALRCELLDAVLGAAPTGAADATAAPACRRLRRDLLPRVHQEDRERVTVAWRMTLLTDADFDCEFRVHARDGLRWIRARGRALSRRERDQHALAVIGTVKDVTRRREAQDYQRIISNALAVAREPIAVTTRDWRLIHANEAFTELTGFEPGDGSRNVSQCLPLQRLLQRTPEGGIGDVRRGRLTMRQPGAGASRQVDVTLTPLAGEHERGASHYIVTVRPLSAASDADSLRLMKLSTLDPSTGLPNRATMQVHLEARLGLREVEGSFALLLIALTDWRRMLDAFGHVELEMILQGYVRQLEGSLHPQDILGRWAEDALLLLLRPNSGAEQADRLARNVIAQFSIPQTCDGLPISLPVNVGIAVAPDDGEEAAQLVRRADSAAYAAKELGYNAFEFFRPALDAEGYTRVHMLALLRGAEQRGEFEYVVQPKVDHALRIVGGEILTRWYSDHYGLVSPALFIPLAEECEQILRIGERATAAATSLVASLRQRGHALPIAVNVSAKQLIDRGLEFMLLAACERYGVEPWMIEIELTESVLLAHLDTSRDTVQRLRAHGFRWALDDFGTGYSSLTYLRELPFDRVKIDRSFMRDICEDERARALLDGILTMCRALGIATVAEGVETEAQYYQLRSMGVDEFQGFWFYRPMPAQEMVRLVARGEADAHAGAPRA